MAREFELFARRTFARTPCYEVRFLSRAELKLASQDLLSGDGDG